MKSTFSLLALSVAALVATPSAALFASPIQTPIGLTSSSFNQNIVYGSGTAVTATMDGGVLALSSRWDNSFYYEGPAPLYTNSFNLAHPATGVPLGQIITSLGDANTTYQLQSYSATDNASYLSAGATSNTLTLSTPAAYETLSFLGLQNSAPESFTIHFVGGGTQSGTITLPSWYAGGSPPLAFQALGRFNGNSQNSGAYNPALFDSVGNDGPDLYYFNVAVTDQTDAITSIDLSIPFNTSSNPGDAIFALSGEAVPTPEPTSIALLGLAATGLLARRTRRSVR